MPFNLSDWLFDTGIGPDGNIENFRYFLPFLIFCGVGLLIWFYYWVEGRKRFIKKGNYPLRNMLDRYLNWLAVICFVGIPIALSRIVLQGFFFSWRLWRILWLVALLVWAVLWIVYFVRKYPQEKTNKKRRELLLAYGADPNAGANPYTETQPKRKSKPTSRQRRRQQKEKGRR